MFLMSSCGSVLSWMYIHTRQIDFEALAAGIQHQTPSIASSLNPSQRAKLYTKSKFPSFKSFAEISFNGSFPSNAY